MKKMLSLCLSALFIVTSISSVYASENSDINEILNYENTQRTVITDQDMIQDYIDNGLVDEMKGYEIDEIIVDFIPIAEEINPNLTSRDSTKGERAIGDYISSSGLQTSNVYFPSLALSSDVYQGPTLSATYSFTEGVEAKYDSSLGVGAGDVKAAVGFSVTGSVSKTKSVILQGVNANQKLNVKVYGNYDKYYYNVYNSISGKFKGQGYAYKPMGLYITQTVYSN